MSKRPPIKPTGGGGIPGITPIARDWANAITGTPAGLAAIGKR